ncbi:inositol monophosphatase [Candidatus Bipolaricaulota bacterium]|nr:inositol monophosphatase [Candidatus Bipolaricaulota bacterium]
MIVDSLLALHTATAAAQAAGRLLLRGFASRDKGVQAKSHRHDPVTIYDREADEAILCAIAAEFPGHAILSEETGQSGDEAAPTWVIDPLDGTNNFLRGIPHFAVSIALRINGEPLVACVHDPIRAETFTAARGGGAHLNGSPIEVSPQCTLDGTAIAVGFSHRPERRATTIRLLPGLIEDARALRTSGCAALDLAYVAAGRFDVAWYLALSAWDIAAGALLIHEAGGRLTDLHGDPLVDPRGGVVASNGHVHGVFLHALGASESNA